jgi:hypothetical protein
VAKRGNGGSQAEGFAHLAMKLHPYFEENIRYERPYLKREWCEQALMNPVKVSVQADGRIRHWTFIPELNKYLRVVTLEDGETVLNAFPDRRFRPGELK